MSIFPDITQLPDSIELETDDGSAVVRHGPGISVGDACVLYDNARVTLRADKTPVRTVVLRWNGRMPENSRFCGDAWERGYGDLEWRGFVPDRVMPWFFYALSGDVFAMLGVKTRPDALCSFTCDKDGVSLTLDVTCGADAAVLGGMTILCAELVFFEETTGDPFLSAVRAAALLPEGAVFPDAPVYGYNNWYYAYGESSAKVMLDSARELSELTDGLANRPYIVIDDCWQKERKSGFIGGSWREGNADFTDMASLASQISQLGVKPGLWLRPLQNRSPELPDDFYRDKDDFILDPTVPGVLEHIAEDVRTVTGWGYRLIKHDYSTCDITGDWGFRRGKSLVCENVHFRNRDRTTAQIIKDLYSVIFGSAGKDCLVLGCNTIGHLGVGYMQLNRTGDDTSGREWARTRKMGVNTLAFRMPQHGSFWFADADCVGITDSVPWEKNRQWLDLLSRSGTPLFVSVAPGFLKGTQLEELKAALASASVPAPAAEPLDFLNDTCPSSWRFSDGIVNYDWY
ncbi:MAG: hypothetical protein K6C36_05240 [Clostridia bacterium]|nr:hypothetical protein [Clostridia bacterium]